MSAPEEVVFLLDVDNTLLNNDQVVADLREHLTEQFGTTSSDRYWEIFETLRSELGYADYLGALQRYRLERQCDTRLMLMSSFLIDYPFATRLFPDALAAIENMAKRGPTVILSDGDVVFQPRKIKQSGLWDAVEGRVLIYIHKERMLDEVVQRYPAKRYVMVDDKLRILAAVKQHWGSRVTSIFPRQGHFAHDAAATAAYPAADLSIDAIGDLPGYDIDTMLQS
jgi:FMN phosphatase YigB (HAD superfamily)